jgi:uncharacterized protein YdhG (YjbR/CyaY superfamily)
VRKAAPKAEETIKYQMPTFTLNGNLVHFAAFKKHIGFYPTPTGTKEFQKELSIYEGAKGSVQFPLDEPVPFGLISEIVRFRAKENLARAEAKGKRSLQKTAQLSRRRKQNDDFSLLVAPARRALEREGINTLLQLSKYSEGEILELHGMGPSTIPKLRSALKAKGLTFRSSKSK